MYIFRYPFPPEKPPETVFWNKVTYSPIKLQLRYTHLVPKIKGKKIMPTVDIIAGVGGEGLIAIDRPDLVHTHVIQGAGGWESLGVYHPLTTDIV